MTPEDEIKAVATKAIPNGQAERIVMEQRGTTFVHVLANGKRFTVFVNTKTKRVEGLQGDRNDMIAIVGHLKAPE